MRRAKGVVIVALIEVGEGGVALLVGNGLLKQHQMAVPRGPGGSF